MTHPVAPACTPAPSMVEGTYTLRSSELFTTDIMLRSEYPPCNAAIAHTWRGACVRHGMNTDHNRASRIGAEFFLIEGVLVAVTDTAKSGKLALAYTSDGPHGYDLRSGVPDAKRISEEEFMARLAHVQLTHADPDAERPKVPEGVQD